MQTRSLLLKLAVLSVLGTAAATAAAETAAPDTSEWTCSKCPFDRGYRSEVELGGGYLDDSSAKFGDYTGLDEEGGYVVANAEGRAAKESGYVFTYELTDLGLDSREVRMSAGKQGHYEFDLFYDAIPHTIWDTTQTPYLRAGKGVQTLPSGWVDAGTTGGMTALAGSLRNVDVGFDRDRYGAAGRFWLADKLQFNLDYRRDDRDGTRTQLGSFGSVSTEILRPVDDSTDRLDATVRYQGKQWFGEHPAYCGADTDCGLVQRSRWSTLLALPTSFWGLLTYALLARLVWRLRTRPSSWRFALTIAAIGAGVSWYLTAVSVFVIEATCFYCLASFGIANALLVLLLLRRPAHMPEHAWSKSLPVPVGSAAVIVFALFLHFSGLFDPAAGPEKPYLKALAIHLRESGARFYGAYWCPSCQKQKALFEASASRLPYVECTPNGRNGVHNFACVSNEIKDYPTWIIDGRRHTGVLPADELARLSGFRWSGGAEGKK